MGLHDIYVHDRGEILSSKDSCVVGVWGSGLPNPIDREAFITSMEDDDLSHRTLYNIYKQAGATFGITSLKEHRNGNCRCL